MGAAIHKCKATRLLFGISIFVCAAITASSVVAQKEIAPESSDVNVRFAQKRVELANADFEVAVARYRRSPQAYSQLSLLRLQDQVSRAELLLENVLEKEKSNPHEAHIKCLERSAELAKRQFDWVSEHSKKFPELFSQEQVKRFHLNLEFAVLALERAKDPDVTSTPMDHLQWQIDQLQSEVLMLQLELERTRFGK